MRKSLSVFGATIVVLSSAPGLAQVMNYGALEELFGEPVTVSATGAPQKASEGPVNMTIITADEIRRSGADNIPDILKFVTGVEVRRYGATASDVGIRGYDAPNSPRVLVLLNGRQIYVDFHSYTAWATVPVQLEEIRQIEVIKGPNTALFGFNAVAGVINIVTFDPIFDSVNEVTARFGNNGNEQMSAVSTVKMSDRAGLRLSANEHGQHESNTDALANLFPPYPDHSYNRSIYAHGRAIVGNGIDTSAEVDAGNAKQFEMTVGAYPGWTTYSYDREKFDVGSRSGIGYLNLNAYRNYVVYDYTAGYDCLTCNTITNSLYVVQASDLLKPGVDHTVRVGLEYRNNRGGGTAFKGMNFGFDVYAADAMWNWQLTRNVALTNSVRIDYMSFTYRGPVPDGVTYTAQDYNAKPVTQPSFNSAVAYKMTDTDTVRVSAARGVQVPDFYALFPEPVDPTFPAGTVQAFEGNPNIKPTVIMNYETDWDRALPQIESTAQLAMFYQTSRSVMGPPGDAGATDPNTLIGYSGNIGSSSSVGGELSLRGSNAEGWRWRAGYALAFITDHLSVNNDPAHPDSTVDYHRGVPNQSVTLGLGRTWREFEADVAARWQSKYDDIGIGPTTEGPLAYGFQRVTVKDYVTVDGRIGYTPIENLTLALSGRQLNQANLYTVNGPQSERRVMGTVTVRY